jgi:hypothetical protein
MRNAINTKNHYYRVIEHPEGLVSEKINFSEVKRSFHFVQRKLSVECRSNTVENWKEVLTCY